MTENYNFSEYNDNEQLKDHLQRFEGMLQRKEEYFFDSDIFEMIVDHYLDSHEYAKATICIEMALSQYPQSADLMLRKAQLLISEGKLSAGLDLLNKVQLLDQSNDELYIAKANIYSQQRNHSEAIKNFLLALEYTNIDKDELMVDIAFEYENCGDFDNAIQFLHRALKINNQNETALYELAYCYDLAGRIEDSVRFYKEYIDEHPYSYAAWYNLGNAYGKLKQYENSVEAFDFCIVINESFSSAYFNKGNVLMQLDRYIDAIEVYKETFNYESPQAVTYNYIGECYECLEMQELALENYLNAIELQPELNQAWLGAGIALDHLDRIEEGIKYIEKAILQDPKNIESLHIYAQALHKLEKYDEALSIYEDALKISDKEKDIWLNYTSLLFDKEQVKEAITSIQTAIGIIDDIHLYYRLVSYLLHNGQIPEAMIYLESALETDFASLDKLLDFYPQAKNFPGVLDLIETYKRK